jgi:sulfate transport system permease protein
VAEGPCAQPGEARKRPRGGEWVLVGVAAGYAGVLLVGPLLALLWGAFHEGVRPFVDELTRPDALHALKLTLQLSLGATAINTVLGVCTAYVLVRHDFAGRRFLAGLVDLPMAVSPVIAGFTLVLLFGRDGWLTPITQALGIQVLFAPPGMLLATTFVSLPFVTREVMPVLEQAGTESEETAQVLGASAWTTFWRITLPGIRWGVLFGISLTFARALGEFGAVLVVSGSVSGLTETATLYIYRSLDERNPVGAHAIAVVLVGCSLVLILAMEMLNRARRPRR